MAVAANSSFTVTLHGQLLTVIPDPTKVKGAKEQQPSYSGTFLAQDSTRQLEKRDVPVYIRRFSRGAGFVEMRDEDDDGGYAWAEDAFTHLGNGVTPSGRRVESSSNFGLPQAESPVTDTVIFEGHVWCLTSSGRLFYFAGGDPTVVPTYSPALNAFGDASHSFHAGYFPTAMVAFQTAAGVAALYVACVGPAGVYRIYQYTGGAWSAGADFVGIDVFKMAVVWWEGRDGVGALRLAIDTGNNVIRHCIAGSDPLLEASYVTPITIGNPSYPLKRLIAAPQQLFGLCTNGLWTFNELRSWNLTPNWEQTASSFQGAYGILYDDHIYGTRYTTLDRYDLRTDGRQERIGGECGPLAFMQDGTPIRGVLGAQAIHDGWLLQVVANGQNGNVYIMRGKDRRVLNVDVPNPMVWYGAEQMLIPDTGVVRDVTHLAVSPAGLTSYLWMFTSVAGTPRLNYAPLPLGSGPLAFQLGGGSFPYNPTARLYMTAQTWGDRNAKKGVRRYDFSNRRTTATSTIGLRTRADGDPLSITDQGTWTHQGTAVADQTSFTPAVQVTGHSIALQAILTTPSPYTAPPIMHELSPRARVVRETFDVRELWVLLERDHELRDGQVDPRSPDAIFAALLAMQDSATTAIFVDETGATHNVYVEQGLDYARVQVDEKEYRTVVRIEISVVS